MIKVLAANAARGPFLELVSAFEKASGHKVSTVWGGTEAVTKKVSDGEVVDIVIIAAPNIDKLILEGKLVAGGRADFAKSVAYSFGPSGFYVADMFKKMGISDQIKDKVKQPASGVQVGELVARGEADLGFQQVSELMHVKGIHYLGPLPVDIQNITVYSAGLHTAAPAPEAAKALVKFFTAPAAAPIIKQTGMAPG